MYCHVIGAPNLTNSVGNQYILLEFFVHIIDSTTNAEHTSKIKHSLAKGEIYR